MSNRVCVAGLWHLGLVSAAVLADSGFVATGFTEDAELIKNLNQGKAPLFEPGLDDLLKKKIEAGTLNFTSAPAEAVKTADFILLTYDTPVDEQDCVDLTSLQATIEKLAPHFRAGAILIVHSQIPVGTCEAWQNKIREINPQVQVEVVCSPENLRLGNAIELYKKPDMLVIGTQTETAKAKAAEFFKGFECEKFFVNWQTAEMAKHALNVFFASSISFANEIGNLCDAVGADGMEIAKILKADSRIGKKAQVRPGLGFAGATLARDLRAIERLGERTGVSTPLVKTVYQINQDQITRVVEKIESWFEGNLSGKQLTVLGLTYKPGTSTLRRSSSLEIMQRLADKGVLLKATDPKADLRELSVKPFFDFFEDPYAASAGSEGFLLLTEWPEYKDLDYKKICSGSKVQRPMFLDAKNHLNREEMLSAGFSYLEIGRGQFKKAVKSC